MTLRTLFILLILWGGSTLTQGQERDRRREFDVELASPSASKRIDQIKNAQPADSIPTGRLSPQTPSTRSPRPARRMEGFGVGNGENVFGPRRYNELGYRYMHCRRFLSKQFHDSFFRPSSRRLDQSALFFSRLWLHHNFQPNEHLWRYAQGDSPLTVRLLEVALNPVSRVADLLVETSMELGLALNDYESGVLQYEAFEALVDEKTSKIRDLAKQIRKDESLRYLDLRSDQRVMSARRARTRTELRALVTRLHELVNETQKGISSFYEKDLTRTIHVEELQKPSFQSLCKGIDELAKVIENSTDDL